MTMQCVETIRLRTSRVEEHRLGQAFVEQMTKNINVPGLTDVRLYGNTTLPYDFYVILAWSIEVPLEGSVFGLGMTKELQQYGLVDHCVWVEHKKEVKND